MNWSRPRAGPETRAETREQEPELSWACKLNWSRPQAGPATDRSPHNQTDGTGSWNGTQNKRGPKQLSWSRGGTGRARQGCPQPGAGPRAGQAAASASAQAARLLPGGSAAPGVAGLLRPSVRPCTGRDVGQSDCAHRAPELLPPLQTLLPPGHGRLCPALSAAAPRCRAPATGGEGRGGRDGDGTPATSPFSPGERARARVWLKPSHTQQQQQQQRWHRPTTSNPRGWGRHRTSAGGVWPGPRQRPLLPPQTCGPGSGWAAGTGTAGPPGPLLHPQTATGHRGNVPSGHRLRPTVLSSHRCCLAGAGSPPSPQRPHGEPCQGTAPTLPVPRPPRRQDKGQSQRALSTKPLPELRPGLAPSHPLGPRQPPAPRSPGRGQDPRLPLHPRGRCRDPAPPAAPEIPAGTAGPGS